MAAQRSTSVVSTESSSDDLKESCKPAFRLNRKDSIFNRWKKSGLALRRYLYCLERRSSDSSSADEDNHIITSSQKSSRADCYCHEQIYKDGNSRTSSSCCVTKGLNNRTANKEISCSHVLAQSDMNTYSKLRQLSNNEKKEQNLGKCECEKSSHSVSTFLPHGQLKSPISPQEEGHIDKYFRPDTCLLDGLHHNLSYPCVVKVNNVDQSNSDTNHDLSLGTCVVNGPANPAAVSGNYRTQPIKLDSKKDSDGSIANLPFHNHRLNLINHDSDISDQKNNHDLAVNDEDFFLNIVQGNHDNHDCNSSKHVCLSCLFAESNVKCGKCRINNGDICVCENKGDNSKSDLTENSSSVSRRNKSASCDKGGKSVNSVRKKGVFSFNQEVTCACKNLISIEESNECDKCRKIREKAEKFKHKNANMARLKSERYNTKPTDNGCIEAGCSGPAVEQEAGIKNYGKARNAHGIFEFENRRDNGNILKNLPSKTYDFVCDANQRKEVCNSDDQSLTDQNTHKTDFNCQKLKQVFYHDHDDDHTFESGDLKTRNFIEGATGNTSSLFENKDSDILVKQHTSTCGKKEKLLLYKPIRSSKTSSESELTDSSSCNLADAASYDILTDTSSYDGSYDNDAKNRSSKRLIRKRSKSSTKSNEDNECFLPKFNLAEDISNFENSLDYSPSGFLSSLSKIRLGSQLSEESTESETLSTGNPVFGEPGTADSSGIPGLNYAMPYLSDRLKSSLAQHIRGADASSNKNSDKTQSCDNDEIKEDNKEQGEEEKETSQDRELLSSEASNGEYMSDERTLSDLLFNMDKFDMIDRIFLGEDHSRDLGRIANLDVPFHIGHDHPEVQEVETGALSDDGEADDEFECDCQFCIGSRANQAQSGDQSNQEQDHHNGHNSIESLGVNHATGNSSENDGLDLWTTERDDEENMFTLNIEELSPLDFLMNNRRNELELMFENVIIQMLAVHPDLLGDQAPPPASMTVIQNLSSTRVTAIITSQSLSCPICLCVYEGTDSVTALPCQHKFHPLCIQAWLKQSGTCPVCRFVL